MSESDAPAAVAGEPFEIIFWFLYQTMGNDERKRMRPLSKNQENSFMVKKNN
jgi:hypothetical protein